MSKSRRKQQSTTPAEQANQMSMVGGQSMPDGSVQHDDVSYRARDAEDDTSFGDTLKSVAGQAWNGLTGAMGMDGESDADVGEANDAPGVRG